MLINCGQEVPPDISEFELQGDLEIELAAYEPMVILPVAITEDPRGRLWVVEMPGYMRDIDGNDEDLPDGRIVFLEDNDGDGLFDSRTVFLDSLLNPRAVLYVYGGILYTDGTALVWTALDGDDAGSKTVVDSLYVVGGNLEHQPNGLYYNLDNWIYSAKSTARYRRIDGNWQKEATSFRGQWGMSSDADGRLVYNHNATPLAGDLVLPNILLGNPYLTLRSNISELYTDDLRVYPSHAPSVNRGYIDGVLDSAGKVINYTSACAPHVFYGNGIGPEFYGTAFVCAPEGNLIAHYRLHPGVELSAERTLEGVDLIRSRDETFRPVNLHTGLDGALYIVDMRKGVIQHRAYMSEYLHDEIKRKELDKVYGLGRIYRLTSPEGVVQRPAFEPDSLIGLLSHENITVRLLAQRELIRIEDEVLSEQLLELTLDADNPTGQIHALWTLEGLGQISPELIERVMQTEPVDRVIRHLLSLVSVTDGNMTACPKLLETASSRADRRIDHLLAPLVGTDELRPFWVKMAEMYGDDPVIAEALVSGIPGSERRLLEQLGPGTDTLRAILRETIDNRESGASQLPEIYTEVFDDDRTSGLKVFRYYCASCHGMDGRGQKTVAPSLVESAVVNGPVTAIADMILHGMAAPSEEYTIPMPAYKNDPNLTNGKIVDLVSYLKSTYTDQWSLLTEEMVDSVRAN